MKLIKRIILIVIIIFSLFLIYDYNKLKIQIDYPKKLDLNESFAINISINKNGHPYTPESVHINFAHKYKKDESVDQNLKNYAPGKYELTYFPKYQGEYSGSIQIMDEGKEITKKLQITVN